MATKKIKYIIEIKDLQNILLILFNTSDRISILFLRNYKGHDKQGWI